MKNLKFSFIILIGLSICLGFNIASKLDEGHLRFLSGEGDSIPVLPGIRCFWLEPNTLSVFDLKDLKRPIKQH